MRNGSSHETKECGCHVAPCPVSQAKANLAEEEDYEDDGVDGVTTKCWNVLELSKFHGARLQRAEIGVVEERLVAIAASGIGEGEARLSMPELARHCDYVQARILDDKKRACRKMCLCSKENE